MHVALVQVAVASKFAGGGISRSTQARARLLVDAGHSVTVLGSFADPNEAPPAPGVRLIHVPRLHRIPRRIPALDEILHGYRLGRWLRRHGEGIDLVDVQEPNLAPGVFAACETRGFRKAHTLNLTALAGAGRFSSREAHLHRRINLAAARRAELNLAISQFVLELYRDAGVPDSKLALVYNALDDMPRIERPGDAPARALWVGRMVPGKGILEAVDAARRALESFPALTFDFVGSGPLEAAGRERAGKETRIRFHGHLREPEALEALWRQATLFLCTTEHETFGRVLAEAMQAGLACVATDLPVLREVLGETGLYAPHGETETAAAKLVELAQDPARRERLGASARERAQREFGLETSKAQLLAAYERFATP